METRRHQSAFETALRAALGIDSTRREGRQLGFPARGNSWFARKTARAELGKNRVRFGMDVERGKTIQQVALLRQGDVGVEFDDGADVRLVCFPALRRNPSLLDDLVYLVEDVGITGPGRQGERHQARVKADALLDQA